MRSPRASSRDAGMGAVAHSLRAATPDEIAELHAEAGRRDWFSTCTSKSSARRSPTASPPTASRRWRSADTLPSLARVVAVLHHTEREHLERFVAAGGRVCVCPTTEGNLGDGLQDFSVVAPATGRDAFCLGSDSNLRISPLEEARWLELAQRLRGEARGVLRDAEGQVGRGLLHAATAGGAAALGVEAGAIAAGRWADFLTLDLNAPALSVPTRRPCSTASSSAAPTRRSCRRPSGALGSSIARPRSRFDSGELG